MSPWREEELGIICGVIAAAAGDGHRDDLDAKRAQSAAYKAGPYTRPHLSARPEPFYFSHTTHRFP